MRKKQKSTEVLDANKTCTDEMNSTEGQGNEYTLDQEQEQDIIVQNQRVLDLNTSQESNEVTISQSTFNDIMEAAVADTSMDAEPLECDDVRRDDSSGDVVHQPPTVVQKVDDMFCK